MPTRSLLVLIFVFLPVSLGITQSTGQAPKLTPTLQWQIAAGSTAKFDVASVRRDTATPTEQNVYSNVPLNSEETFNPTGGLFSANNRSLDDYILFAYKLTSAQRNALDGSMPKETSKARYDIQAHAQGNPTKDQFRLMMQALIANRFKLVVHYETKQMRVFALVMDKPGELGPMLQKHPDNQSCPSSAEPTDNNPTTNGDFPVVCGSFIGWPEGGLAHAGARNIDMQTFAGLLTNPFVGIDRPVVDKTGLTGKYDFAVRFTPIIVGPPPPNFQPDPSGPSFVEALKTQLGLKLEAQTGGVELLVIDHIEEPSAN